MLEYHTLLFQVYVDNTNPSTSQPERYRKQKLPSKTQYLIWAHQHIHSFLDGLLNPYLPPRNQSKTTLNYWMVVEIPKSQGRGWRFDFRLWNLLYTWHNTCEEGNCLMCFGIGILTFCLVEKRRNQCTVVSPQPPSPYMYKRERWNSHYR